MSFPDPDERKWVVGREDFNLDGAVGKRTAVHPATGVAIDMQDSSAWMTFDAAVEYADAWRLTDPSLFYTYGALAVEAPEPLAPVVPTGAVPAPLQLLPATQAAHVLTFNNRNRYEASLPNLETALAKQQLAVLGFDTFRGQIMIATPRPVGEAPQWQALKDTDMVRLRIALERNNFAAIGKDLMRDALRKVAEDNSYDSAVVWLNGLVWEGVPRIDKFLATHCGAADDEYSEAVSRYIWTGLPARVYEPGCQLDMVPAFQSKQGTRKSSGLQALAPHPDYFTDGASLVKDDPDFMRLIRGKIVVEIAELAGLSKADVDVIKRMITRRKEEWTEKYETLTTSYLRRCMFFASTNKEQFLPEDETGQRRWLPVEIEILNDVRIARDREQLWAEGAQRWRERKSAGQHGVDWYQAERLAAGRHQKYELGDVWESDIEKWLNTPLEIPGQVLRPAPCTQPVQIRDVLEGAIRLAPAQMDRRAALRAGNALRALGYERRKIRMPGRTETVWRYVRKDAMLAAPVP